MNQVVQSSEVITFAERVMALLDEGSFNATYKFAVLLGIMDVCIEQTSITGDPPNSITTRQLAERVASLYWGQTLPFQVAQGEAKELRQNKGGQAEIVSEIITYQAKHKLRASSTLRRAQAIDIESYQSFIHKIEWKLIEMPLPKLQRIAGHYSPFIYQINWSDDVKKAHAFQRGGLYAQGFDNRLHLQPNVGRYFATLNSLLRPLIYRQWAAMVARINKLDDARLEAHLFGFDRISTKKTHGVLQEIQSQRCFFCHNKLGKDFDVDHFIPWTRYPNNCLENFVLAHSKCNRNKRHYLASEEHLENWLLRFKDDELCNDFESAARSITWESHMANSLGIGRAIYGSLPENALLWKGHKDQFVESSSYAIQRCFES